LMVGPNCVETKAKKFDKVEKVSDLTHKEKVYTKWEELLSNSLLLSH
jgi:hypothetical protein